MGGGEHRGRGHQGGRRLGARRWRGAGLLRPLVYGGVASWFGHGWGAVAHACPACASVLSSDSGGTTLLARGYVWSILMMVTLPFVLVGIVATLLVQASQRPRVPRVLGEGDAGEPAT